MITISDKAIQKNILKYFDYILRTGEEIIITNDNIPVLKIVPFRQKRKPDEVFKDVRGKIRYYDDILKPETDEWSEL
jgi:antitoxin (DNA-binding transcriptional repressor) of toxin-antitoxin stability system